MRINDGRLTLHDGDTLESCMQTLIYDLGENLLYEHGYDDFTTLCDQIARDNGFHEGLYDPSLSHLSTISEENTDPTEIFLPEWIAKAVGEDYDNA